MSEEFNDYVKNTKLNIYRYNNMYYFHIFLQSTLNIEYFFCLFCYNKKYDEFE